MENKVGIKHDQGKLEYHLLSSDALNGLIEILMFGKERYGAFNWAKGLTYSRVYDALERHIKAWWNGENLDPDSHKSHLYHVLCNAMFLAHFISYPEKYEEFDDRPHKLLAPKEIYTTPQDSKFTPEEIKKLKEQYLQALEESKKIPHSWNEE